VTGQQGNVGSGVVLEWPLGERLPEQVATVLMGPGAPFEITRETVNGFQYDVFAQRRRNLREALAAGIETHGDAVHVSTDTAEFTFNDLGRDVASMAAALRDRYGIGAGDRVAVASANGYEYLVTFWATVSLGAVLVALNGWWTEPEMRYGIGLTEPLVLLGDERRLDRLGAVDGLPTVRFEESFKELIAHDLTAALPDTPIAEDDPFVVLFTSGTTGRPKGATLSHRNNLHWAQSVMLHGAARIAIGDAKPSGAPRTVMISAAPMFHVGGLNCQVVPAILTGGKIVYPPPGRWSEIRQFELTQAHGATNWSLVPTQAWRLVDHPNLHDYDLSSLSSIGGGSSFWPPALIARLAEELPHVAVGTGYGMTETNGGGTSHGGAAMAAHPEAVGMPSPLGTIKAIGPEGETLPVGEVGEVCMRSACTFLGYWNNPDATAAAIDGDGWYHTGDFGRVEHGLLFLDGRRRDLIIRGGENIYPREIEQRLVEHPEVEDVAVIGVPHQVLGAEVKAFVVLRAGSTLDEADIKAFVGEALASFKVPAYIEIRESLPYNATGKVLKHLLEAGGTSDFIEE
jgi:acyl-CoA synthetase (AMP-forming)/AMP-acid ligase II